MNPRRRLALVLLVSAPIVAVVIAGAWALVRTGGLFWLGWLFPLCWGAAWLVARKRKHETEPLPDLESRVPAYWTARDREAGTLVDARIRRIPEIPIERLTEPRFYLDSGIEVALEVARHYHPRSRDAVGPLRVTEIVAALNLAFEDLERRIEEYVPGSHLVTVDQWRLLARSPKWLDTATQVGRVVAGVIQPLSLGRFLLSEGAAAPVRKRVKENVLFALYASFLREFGFYLVEMHSGRLRAGSDRYKEFLSGGAKAKRESEDVTVALVGQTGAGKSSLVNCLFRERRADTDVLPSTSGVQRHRLKLPEGASEVVLLDTPGYGTEGATKAQQEEVQRAWRGADLVLLVMDVQNLARSTDLELVREHARRMEDEPHRKPPPVLGVLTHVDRLSPVLEWDPPYDWEEPERPKEQSIRQAVDYLRGVFGDALAGVVPVCSDFERERVFGVEEWLLPAMTALLGEARACSLLRVLHEELDKSRVERVFRQLRNAGRSLLRSAR